MALSFSGCANFGNSTAIAGNKIANENLSKSDSPVRYEAIEHKNGVTHKPHLVGKISKSVADLQLKQDTLNLIILKEETQKIELVQTRYVIHRLSPMTYKEVWIVRNKTNNVLHGHTVYFTQATEGGVDIKLAGSSIVFESMLKI
ncbi:hypothetical protein [Sulfurimonas sp.]|uniref:hypothetical protein n=1 Tax=Sulfurimonas sp. TaxID=2022749 RepID=UPI0035663889